MINKLFNNYDEQQDTSITPHDLRHFFCSHLLDNGFTLHEARYLTGHSNINTMIIHANPTKEFMKQQLEKNKQKKG